MSSSPAPDPERFQPSKRVLLIDRLMNRFINVGGVGIIVAVMGILVFIAAKVVPLFGGADVELAEGSKATGADTPLVLGIDEWGELPFVIDASGTLRLFPRSGEPIDHQLSGGRPISAASYSGKFGIAVVALDDGSIVPVTISYSRPLLDGGGAGDVVAEVEIGDPLEFELEEGATIKQLAFAKSDRSRLIAALADSPEGSILRALRYTQKRTLLGDGELKLESADDLSPLFDDKPTEIRVNAAGDSVVVATEGGEILYLFAGDGGFELRQRFRPFPDEPVAAIDYLLGDNTLSLVSPSGEHVGYSLFKADDDSDRLFGKTREFEPLGGAPTAFAASQRNRSFVIAAGKTLSLRHGTTSSTRWQEELDFEPRLLVMNQKKTAIVALGSDGNLHRFKMDDPHPEAGMRAFFGKVWYEGSREAAYVWQSTGGSDEFESKLSLVPLIFGTLKGTFYAMLFALPIAILAAVYTSQFLHPNIKAIVKPTMEIMASLPSVVLGFLGALWLAPRIENHTVSLALIVVFVPLAAFFLGWFWTRAPIAVRSRIKPGYEFLALGPVILIGVWACWHLGPGVEKLLFSSASNGTFKTWWSEVAGNRFEQRNCVIIGIMMGFAVIPIIFTITEDALSSVPAGLRSASLACGASRWQTAWRVVLPTASAGIFSAAMIGLGRAVGETMVVVMATGNTPIMELNIFSGMRTLSANIAVEIPEAPVNGTLYRTLFLGALVLFLMTFVLNTLAELLRQHLREKYKTV